MNIKEIFLSWGMLILSVIFNVLGVFIIKFKLNELGAIPLDSFKTFVGYVGLLLKAPFVLVGILLFFLSPVLFAIALSRMDIVIAYPVQLGLNFLFLILLAVFVLGEQLSFFKILGMCFVLVGILFLTKSG